MEREGRWPGAAVGAWHACVGSTDPATASLATSVMAGGAAGAIPVLSPFVDYRPPISFTSRLAFLGRLPNLHALLHTVRVWCLM